MTSAVERSLYGDRTILNRYNDDTGETTEGWADLAHEAVRAMNHLTIFVDEGIPAPVVYSVLGNVAGLAGMLPQLCTQLANGLAKSLDHFDVYDTKQEPAITAQEAGELLGTAAALAAQLADALNAAQSAVNSQGYNAPGGSED